MLKIRQRNIMSEGVDQTQEDEFTYLLGRHNILKCGNFVFFKIVLIYTWFISIHHLWYCTIVQLNYGLKALLDNTNFNILA